MNDKSNEPLYFLGPKSENRPFFKETIDLVLNDFVFWKRNYHPKDPPVVSYSQSQSKENIEFRENFTNEVFKLLSDLKLDPPFFSPRYMAHMISETSLPGLIAYISTLMYNPNNVSSESSPITLKYELEVGKQLSELFGMDSFKSFGHIASGGTIANYESLFYNMGLRFLPLSFALFLNEQNIEDDQFEFDKIINIPYEDYPSIIDKYKKLCLKNDLDENGYRTYTVGFLGLRKLEKVVLKKLKKELPEIVLVIPSTGHYSWSRGVKLLGLGEDSLIKIPLNKNLQMDIDFLKETLKELKREKKLILQMVGVFGTTEFGSFDSIFELTKLKKQYQNNFYFPIHIDAAYGGYFSTLFVDSPPKSDYRFFENLKMKHQELKNCDSITVDPHKLGFTPYGAGCFIFKHGDLKDFISEKAEYCFSPKSEDAPVSLEIGKYILEGSKPGASAAAVYFNHKLIPLNYNGHGKLLEKLCLIAQNFYIKLLKVKGDFELVPLFEPQSNIICFFIKSSTSKTLSDVNVLTTKVAARFGVKKIDSIQEYDYIVSNTTFNLEHLHTYPSVLDSLDMNTTSINLVRMVFMNSYHDNLNAHGISYTDDFIDKVLQFIENA